MALDRSPNLSGGLDGFLAEIDGVIDSWEGSIDSASWAADGSHEPASLNGDYYGHDHPGAVRPRWNPGGPVSHFIATQDGAHQALDIGVPVRRPPAHPLVSVQVTVTNLTTGQTTTLDAPLANTVTVGIVPDDDEDSLVGTGQVETLTIEFRPQRDPDTGIAYTVTTNDPGT